MAQDKFGVLPKLTKRYILNHISQEDIFEHYLGVPVQQDELICSPLREDRSPTCGFYYTHVNGELKLRLRDFAGYFWGDCFDLVAYIIKEDATDPTGFNKVLERIAKDFSLHQYEDKGIRHTIVKGRKAPEVNKFVDIDVEFRQWDIFDKKYWGNICIDLDQLSDFFVYPLQRIWLNKQLNYEYQGGDQAYGYYLGVNDDGKHLWKIYFPKRKKFRFLGNSGRTQGLSILKPAQCGLITKSYKDVICLSVINRGVYDFNSVAPSSETHLISPTEMSYLNNQCDFWYSLMDYDDTGIRMSWKLRKEYNVTPLFLRARKERKAYIDGDLKDFSDFAGRYGRHKAFDLIKRTWEYFEEEMDEFYNKLNNFIDYAKENNS